jgi:hypothetical protein
MAHHFHFVGRFHLSIVRLDKAQKTSANSRQLSNLESLPDIVLGKIASNLDSTSLFSLLLAAPDFVHQLRNGVQWKAPPSSGYYDRLDEMRIVTLSSVQAIQKMVIKKKPPLEAVLGKFRRLLQSPSLRKVEVGQTTCIEGEKISDSVS